MVSIDEIIPTERAIHSSPKANALFSFLFGETFIPPVDELNEGEKVYFSLLDALVNNQSSKFLAQYNELNKRQIVEDQPLVYDNYLLFVLLIGIMKFNTSKHWLKSVLSLRKTQNEPEKSITISFINLIENNLLSTDGIPSILLAACLKSDKKDLDTFLIRNSFEANRRIVPYIEKDLFLACIVTFTYNYIVSVSITEDAVKLRKFEKTFLKRVLLLQNIIYGLILVIIAIVWFYLISRYPKVKEFANDLGALLQLIGIGILAVGLNMIKNKFGSMIKVFFGYWK
ncbi:MAG: hypothetical protein EOO43_03470 [Flavobacterium sp.]|nr:MAG: hypothetical protein EOO43_03470 [Flavobacterium sp.]